MIPQKVAVASCLVLSVLRNVQGAESVATCGNDLILLGDRMKRFFCVLASAFSMVCGQALADGMRSGWSLATLGDPFTKQVSVFAVINETSDAAIKVNEATLGFTCTKAFFRSERFSFGTKVEKVAFRIGSEIVEAVFEPMETEVGTVFAMSGPVAVKLRSGLMGELAIGFQTKEKTGEFSAIGANKILTALDGLCKIRS